MFSIYHLDNIEDRYRVTNCTETIVTFITDFHNYNCYC